MDIKEVIEIILCMYTFGSLPADIPKPNDLKIGNKSNAEFCEEMKETLLNGASDFGEKFREVASYNITMLVELEKNMKNFTVEITRLMDHDCDATIDYLKSEKFEEHVQELFIEVSKEMMKLFPRLMKTCLSWPAKALQFIGLMISPEEETENKSCPVVERSDKHLLPTENDKELPETQDEHHGLLENENVDEASWSSGEMEVTLMTGLIKIAMNLLLVFSILLLLFGVLLMARLCFQEIRRF